MGSIGRVLGARRPIGTGGIRPVRRGGRRLRALVRPLALLLLLLILTGRDAEAAGRGVPQGRLLVTTLEGARVDLATPPGWRVIYFWGDACPCVRACERYSFVPLARKYRGRVSFFAVVSGRFDLGKPRRQLGREIAARHLPFPALLDTAHRVAAALGARVTPQTFLLDPAGRVVFSGMPDDSRRYLGDPSRGVAQTYLARALSQALAGRPVSPPDIDNQGCVISE